MSAPKAIVIGSGFGGLAAAMRMQTGKAPLTREPSFDVKPRWDLREINLAA